jgi:hypothetical protein
MEDRRVIRSPPHHRRDRHRAAPLVPDAHFCTSSTTAGVLRHPETDLWVWRRRLDPILATTTAALADVGTLALRAALPRDDRAGGAERLLAGAGIERSAGRTLLASDIAALAFLLAQTSGAAEIGLALQAATRRPPAPVFHVDGVGLRLLCTYAGPGTEWVPHHAVDRAQLGLRARTSERANAAIVRDPRSVRRLQSGWVAILKGRRAGRGLVHRSPRGGPRLLLRLDAKRE